MTESLTYEEAQAVVDRGAEFCVAVHTGNRVDLVARNEYGQLTVDTYVDAVGERRLLPITESRFADLVVRYEARREPVEDSPFAAAEETAEADDA